MNKKRSAIGALIISAACLVGIANKESFVGKAMVPVKGDVPTLGFGETKGVRMGMTTTPQRALARLQTSINEHADGIKECLDGVELYQWEWDAYVSLAYNIGVNAFCRSSIPKLLLAQRYEDACNKILEFNKFKGKPLRGLTIRRQEERDTCMGGGNV